MNNHLVMIKVGGSLITDKTKPFTALPETIKTVATELQQAHDQRPDIDFLLSNGAGSFAHFDAHHYGLSKGAKTKEQYFGVCLAHNGVRRLNGMLTDELTNAGLAAFGLSPSSFLLSGEGRITKSYLDSVKYLLAKGCIPVLHGDTIFDTEYGIKIYSGEEIIHECAKELRQQYTKITVIYLLCVDGLLDREGASVPRLKSNDDIFLREGLKHDVTGGIVGKIKSAREAVKIADEVFLINGNAKRGIIEAITTGNIGTRVL